MSPWQVVAAQAAAGAVCAAVIWVPWPHAAVSALYGAAATVVPNALLARGVSRRVGNPMAAAAGFLLGEMVKIVAALVMLAIAPRVVPGLSWPALLATMLACLKVNWFALLWRGRAKSN